MQLVPDTFVEAIMEDWSLQSYRTPGEETCMRPKEWLVRPLRNVPNERHAREHCRNIAECERCLRHEDQLRCVVW